MKKKSGWAEPKYIIGEPRVQKVGGFTYLFVEQKHVEESQVGVSLGPLFEKIHEPTRRDLANLRCSRALSCSRIFPMSPGGMMSR